MGIGNGARRRRRQRRSGTCRKRLIPFRRAPLAGRAFICPALFPKSAASRRLTFPRFSAILYRKKENAKGMDAFCEKAKAVVIGHAVGDALGVPVEFFRREALELAPVTDMSADERGGIPAGSWSDDTSMSACALDGMTGGKIDYDKIMRNFSAWLTEGKFTPGGVTFGAGNTCVAAIGRYLRGMPYDKCGLSGEYDNGNGSLMRIHPFVLHALFKGMSEEEMLRLTGTASSLIPRAPALGRRLPNLRPRPLRTPLRPRKAIDRKGAEKSGRTAREKSGICRLPPHFPKGFRGSAPRGNQKRRLRRRYAGSRAVVPAYDRFLSGLRPRSGKPGRGYGHDGRGCGRPRGRAVRL